MEISIEVLQELAQKGLLNTASKHDPSASVPYGSAPYGPGGMFSEPGVRPEMYSAVLQPRTYLRGIPMLRSNIYNERVAILTQQTATQGTNPTDVCGDPPYPGDLYKCTVNRVFGTLFVGSKKVKVPEIGLVNDRATMMHTIMNYAQEPDPLVPDLLRRPGVNFMSDSAIRLYEVGTAARRAIAGVGIDGDSSNTDTSAELGFLQEFDGLSLLVKSGYTDTSSATCPAADSTVLTWDARVNASVGGRTIVQAIHDLVYGKMQLAQQLGLDGVTWRFVMDQRLFRALVFLFSCSYANARCTDGSAGNPIGRTADAIEARYNEMTQGQYLLVSGVPYPVYFTSGSETALSGGSLVGDLFFVPERWSGGPLLYLQYFPMNNQYIQEFNNVFGNSTARTALNDGLYMTALRSDGFCDRLLAVSKMRLMLDAPFLAGRIDDIQFDSYIGYRDWDPSASSFNGGGASLYSA